MMRLRGGRRAAEDRRGGHRSVNHFADIDILDVLFNR
jgi:hypothetical protein